MLPGEDEPFKERVVRPVRHNGDMRVADNTSLI